jgi:hypothetical protein
MESAAELVVSALAALATVEDPGRPLDMFPRDLETREETAHPLVDAVWDLLSNASVFPDGEGELRRAADLKLHPVNDEVAVRQWWQCAAPDLRAEFFHPSCYRGQRLNRLKAHLRRSKKDGNQLALTKWLEAIASLDLTQTRAVFQLLKRISDAARDFSLRNELHSAKVIPAEQGKLGAAVEVVFSSGVVPAGRLAVHYAVAQDRECRLILEQVLGVRPLDDSQWRALLNEALVTAERSWGQASDHAWANFWSCLRKAPQTVSLPFLTSFPGRVHARSRSGQWQLANRLLRPGLIAANDLTI